MRCPWILLTFATMACGTTRATPIEADRPGLVESTSAVPDGALQLELGYETAWDTSGASTPTLLRFGIGSGWELRAESDGLVRDASGHAALADLALGVKREVQGGALGGSGAWLVHLALPTGGDGLRGVGLRPAVEYTAGWELSDAVELDAIAGIARQHDAGGRAYTSGSLGAVVETRFSDALRVYAELALPRIARSADGGDEAEVDAGATLLWSDRVQLDFEMTRGLGQHGAGVGVGAGLSIRW